MPWKIVEESGKYCIHKEGTGEAVHCHETREDAMEQMRALYASEDKTVSIVDKIMSFLLPASDRLKKEELDGIVDGIKELSKTNKEREFPFMVWKEESGRYRFMCVYSNHFRDQDFPPEIISSDAHKEFIARVDKGEDQYPELWHWHIPGTMWGKSDWLCFTDEGFALASGYILPGHEKEAESLSGMTGIRTSHGMPRTSIQYAADDKGTLTRYSSIEISDLPAKAAANMLTDFMVLEVEEMIPEAKKAYLKQVGLSDETIGSIEKNLEDKAKAADVLGLEHKEVEPEKKESVDENKEAESVSETVTETVTEITTEKSTEFASRADVNALVEALSTVVDSIKAISVNVDANTVAMAEIQKNLKERDETPTPSLNLAFLKGLSGLSPIGNEKAVVSGKSESTSGPRENRVATKNLTGIPFIDMFTSRAEGEQQEG